MEMTFYKAGILLKFIEKDLFLRWAGTNHVFMTVFLHVRACPSKGQVVVMWTLCL